MRLCYDACRVLFLLACISRILTAPINDNKKNERCATAKGSIRSTVEDNDSKNKQVHLLADLEALSHGIKRAATEEDCSDSTNADKKNEVTEQSVGSVPGLKTNEPNDVKEGALINDLFNDQEETKGSPIQETAKAAIRSTISANKTDTPNTTTSNAALPAPSLSSLTASTADALNLNGGEKKGVGALKDSSTQNATSSSESTTNAKTFIARNRNAAPNKGQVAAKANIEKSPRRNSKLQPLAKKVQQAQGLHRSLHASIVPDNAPSMQRGALSKLQDLQVKGSTKSTSSIIAPLNNAIKSLDSATKLLGAVAAGKATTPLANTVQVNKFVSAPAIANPAFVPKAKAVNASLLDVPSIARSAATTSDAKAVADVTGGKPSSSAPASSAVQGETKGPAASAPAQQAAPQAAGGSKPAAKPASITDPYAEIASGPDSPKTPDLKTGSEKAGLPVMKVDPGAESPEPVSFDKEGPPSLPQEAPAVDPSASSSSSRPGPQDVGGILDKITDRLNKGGSAIEQPLPPTEAKSITDQLSSYDNDAMQTAKSWETSGLKAIEKLKSAEFKGGSMKTELSKELNERLGGGAEMGEGEPAEMGDGAGAGIGGGGPGGGYNAALGAGLGSEEVPSEVSNYGPPSRANYAPAGQQWGQTNAIENLDSEAQREEQSFGQYAAPDRGESMSERYGSPAEGDSSMTPDSNAYDRQDISNYLSQSPPHDGMDIGSEQGNYFKRSVILRPLYYYYHHLPYAFKHPYDD